MKSETEGMRAARLLLQKDDRRDEVKSLAASDCSLEAEVRKFWRSLSAPKGTGGGAWTEGYHKARAEAKLEIGKILKRHQENSPAQPPE